DAVFGRHPCATGRRAELVHQALFGFTWHDGLVLVTALAQTLIGSHVRLALALLGIMAGEAVLFENWRHVADEADRSFGRGRLCGPTRRLDRKEDQPNNQTRRDV